jgi:lactoylglutathione lyase
MERCTAFYATYFDATVDAVYSNPKKGFQSCFLGFGSGARIEVMTTTSHRPVVIQPGAERMGLTHIAICVGSPERADQLTATIREAGFAILDGPRRTGDGYYESVVLDPDGNRVEIAA